MLNELLHVAVLCSKRAPGLDALLRHPSRGVVFDVDCVLTTEPTLASSAVPFIAHPIHEFYDGRPIGNREIRRRYDGRTAGFLKFLGIDIVLTLGYLYVITEPLLEAFPDRIYNVHDSDVPRYPGLHATRDAIVAGERQTFSSVHLVTSDLDAGPVMVRSEPFPVAAFAREAARAGRRDIVNAYAYAQREWMMHTAWGGLVAIALEQSVGLREQFA